MRTARGIVAPGRRVARESNGYGMIAVFSVFA